MKSNLSEDVTRRGVVLSTRQAGAELRSKKGFLGCHKVYLYPIGVSKYLSDGLQQVDVVGAHVVLGQVDNGAHQTEGGKKVTRIFQNTIGNAMLGARLGAGAVSGDSARVLLFLARAHP